MESGPPAQPDAGPSAFVHQPVLASEVLQAFRHLPTGPGRDRSPCLIDCTLGGGGHSALLLAAHPDLDLIGLDQDPSARAAAAETLAPFGQRVQIVAANFADFLPQSPVQGVLADLGVSSPQLDWAERGFSFRADGPLDMRMNPESDRTAALLIEQLSETDLSDLLFHCGEERLARRIARRIKTHLLEQGPFSGTAALAHLIRGCYPPQMRRGRIHPATRTFQALRIAVNRELEALDRLLTVAPDWLSPGGILAIISFHSLEDRRVKQAFLTDERLERIERKAIQAGVVEQSANPRSRSARLRLARRRAHGN